MPDVFITLEEAAAFESVSYKTLTQRIYRNPQQYKTKSQAREGGGKDQVLISTSSLSAKARKAWRAAQKVEGSEVIIDKRAQEAVPWYVTADLNQYTEANKKRFYEAVELAARVQDFIDYDGPDRTGYAERYALGLGISPQSLYRYMKNVLEANAWALKLEKEDGKSRDYFRALALCRKPKETGTFPSLTDEQKAIIENIWFDKRFAANLGTIEMLYERFELEAERREWEEYPSIKTVARYIKFLMGQRGAESARFLAANGTREWKNKRMMKGKRDATSLRVMEYVVGDEHTFDFWVQWTAPNGKIKAVRPKLVAWLDMRSRAIIGDVACVNANSQTLKESLVKMIYGKAFFATDHPVGKDKASNKGTAKLSMDAYKTARTSMMSLKNSKGRPLALVPDLLVVPPALEADARDILVADFINGTKNTMQGTAEIHVEPRLASDSAWFLLCTKRPVKPLIYQQRKKAKFVSKTNETDDNVFMSKKFIYGADSRGNAGFGFWQMAYGSDGTTT